jgi:hypothetical protein
MTPTRRASRILRRAALAGALVLTSVAPALAARPDALPDVTATTAGRAAASQAAIRFTEAGVPTKAADLRVYQLGSEDYVVGPTGSSISVIRDAAGGVAEIRTAEAQNSPTSAFDSSEFVAAAAPYWTLVGSTCWARTTKTGGWMDTCYQKHKLINDGSTSYDYFELHMFATAKSVYPYRLLDAYVHAAPSGGSTQSWHDWDPGADLSISCQTVTIGVVAQGVAIAYNHNACEQWDITKYAAAGTFRNTWRAGLTPPLASERETAFTIASRVANGGTATWGFSWNFTAACC